MRGLFLEAALAVVHLNESGGTLAILGYTGAVDSDPDDELSEGFAFIHCIETCRFRPFRVQTFGVSEDGSGQLVAIEEELGELRVKWRPTGPPSFLQKELCIVQSITYPWRLVTDYQFLTDPVLPVTGIWQAEAQGTLGDATGESLLCATTARLAVGSGLMEWTKS